MTLSQRLPYLVAACVLAILIATQPVSLVLAVGAALFVSVLALITPYTILALLLILAPLRTLIATEAAFPLPLDIGQLLFFAFVGIWVVERVVKRERILDFAWSPLYVPLGIFVAVTGLTILAPYSMQLSEWLKWLLVLALVPIIVRMGHWRWLVLMLVAAGAGNALVGIYIFFGGSGADHLVINDRFFRAFGTFGQPNPFGGFMGLLLPIALMATVGYGIRWWQMFRQVGRWQSLNLLWAGLYSGLSLVLLLGLVMSWSRGAWLGFVAAVAVMAFALPRKIQYSVVLSVSGGLVIGVLWFGGFVPDSIAARITSSTEEYFTVNDVRGVDITHENYAIVERLAHWQAALNMAQQYPWLGVGLGNYEVAYAEFRLINWDEPLGHAHNYYLNILAEAGIIGLLSYLTLWGFVFWLTWQIRQHPDTLARSIAIGLLGTWTYLFVHSLLDNLYVNNIFIHLGVMLGMVAILYGQMRHSYLYDTSRK